MSLVSIADHNDSSSIVDMYSTNSGKTRSKGCLVRWSDNCTIAPYGFVKSVKKVALIKIVIYLLFIHKMMYKKFDFLYYT